MSLMKHIFLTAIAFGASYFAGIEFGINVFFIFMISFYLIVTLIESVLESVSKIISEKFAYESREIIHRMIDIEHSLKEIDSGIGGLREEINQKTIAFSFNEEIVIIELRKIRDKLDEIKGNILDIRYSN
jgi:hypothetical protein